MTAVINEAENDGNETYCRLYYGFGGTAEQAKKADVLLLGNSRVLFGFWNERVKEAERRGGFRIFNMCYPAADGVSLALDTIRRHDLRPAVVVVNQGKFFAPTVSSYGRDVMAAGSYGAWLRMADLEVSWKSRTLAARGFPHFRVQAMGGPLPRMYGQSKENGCMVFNNIEEVGAPRKVADLKVENDEVDGSELPLAREFKAEMERRGSLLVLTNIPFPGGESIHGALARELGVPFLAPRERSLETFDQSHLTRESADRFAAAFFEEMVKSPRIRQALKNK